MELYKYIIGKVSAGSEWSLIAHSGCKFLLVEAVVRSRVPVSPVNRDGVASPYLNWKLQSYSLRPSVWLSPSSSSSSQGFVYRTELYQLITCT